MALCGGRNLLVIPSHANAGDKHSDQESRQARAEDGTHRLRVVVVVYKEKHLFQGWPEGGVDQCDQTDLHGARRGTVQRGLGVAELDGKGLVLAGMGRGREEVCGVGSGVFGWERVRAASV